MVIAIIPAVVCAVGVLVWALATNALLKRVGEYMFACGLLVTLFVVAVEKVKIP